MSADRSTPRDVEGRLSSDIRNSAVPRRVADWATDRDGTISFDELLALGVGRHQIQSWVNRGWLIREYEGVFSVGHRQGSRAARRRAAVLAAGDGAALSHLTACAHRGLLPWDPPVVDVMVPRRGERARDGIRFHRPRVYVPGLDTELVQGIPCTTVARSLVDVSGVLSYDRLERVVEQAEFLNVLDLREIGRVLARIERPRGIRHLRRALGPERLDAARAGSELERAYLRLIRDGGIEKPVLQHPVELAPHEWVYLDCWFARAALNVEVDGPHHRRPLQARRDARRDARLRAMGIRVHRFSDIDIERKPQYVIETTRTLLLPSRDD